MSRESGLEAAGKPAYGPQSGLLEYIYGITYEIWEQRGVELIRQYYAPDIRVFALSGLSDGVDEVVRGTRDMLRAFPDRLLLAENVIWSPDEDGDYSSHRIMSPMTNRGATQYGPATGRKVQVRTIADCLVRQGVITREWLIRDTLPLVRQLGFDPVEAARRMTMSEAMSEPTREWFAAEHNRTERASSHPLGAWAEAALACQWSSAGPAADYYAPFCVVHPGPQTWLSGLAELERHGASLREAFAVRRLFVDHVATQPWGHDGQEIAVRWTVSATHEGNYQGVAATGNEVFVLGSTHWRVAGEKIFSEWTVFDGMGVLAQLVSRR